MKLIDRIRHSKFHRDNRGAAMIVAIVVSVIVIAFTLSLLLVSYSLFISSQKKITQSQVKELAKSISLELEEEITTPKFNSYEEFRDSVRDIEGMTYTPYRYNIWYYLRYNVHQSNWVNYDASRAGRIEANAFRYFDLSVTGPAENYATMADDISVCMYWEDDDMLDVNGALLTVIVTVTKGDQTASFTSQYELELAEEDESDGDASAEDAYSALTDDQRYDSTPDDAFNPSHNKIDMTQIWHWGKIN